MVQRQVRFVELLAAVLADIVVSQEDIDSGETDDLFFSGQRGRR